MIKLYALIAALAVTARLRFERRVEERGMGTLEVVVIAAGLLAAAIGLVKVIQIAVKNRAGGIH